MPRDGEVTFTVCGGVPWEEMRPETQEAIRAVVRAAYDHLGEEQCRAPHCWSEYGTPCATCPKETS